jgi:hypothetical protein
LYSVQEGQVLWIGLVRETIGECPRYGNFQAGSCSVNSVGGILRPASTSPTRIPASVSRLAAHPPVAPEPTTTAS